MGKLIGSPIRAEVAKSIALRQKVMNEEPVAGSTYNPETKIKYVSSRMPWVRLSSSINLSGAKATYFSQLTSGPAAGDSLARRFVLKNYAEDSYFQTQGLQGYSNSLNLGIRPEPGITSVNIKHFNRYGSLRSATVNFVCWTLEQLEIMDVLYMRPGYTALLEFGHSVYLDTTGNVQNTRGGINFFDGARSTKGIYTAIENQRVENNYHYEGMFGFIKNFKWTFRDDGGYDCVAELVSIGEVVESIKASFATPGFSLNNEGTTLASSAFAGKDRAKNSEQTSLEELSTVMHQILATIKNDAQDLYTPGQPGFYISTVSPTVTTSLKTTFPTLKSTPAAEFAIAMYSPGTPTVDGGVSNNLAADQQPTYIKLSLLLDILNIGVPGDSATGEKFYKFWTPSTVSAGPFHGYKYSEYRPSIDPGICLVHAHDSIFDFNTIAKGDRSAVSYTKQNRIDQILVNVDFIITQYEPNIDTLAFIKKILAGIQAALGNVNELELQYFEEEGLYAVVDRHRIVESTYESRPKLEIFGNKTFAKSVTLSSLLSPKITTMIAIGAQAGGSSGGIEGTAFAKLNAGLTDRIKPVKLAAAEATKDSTAEASTGTTTLSPLDIIEGHLFNIYRDFEYVPKDCEDVKQIYADYLADKTAETSNPSFSFVIPFELSLTTDGISGLRISEAFDISDEILPAPYRNQSTGRSIVSFLVTGLDQNITSAGWTTGIRSQMYISETSKGKYGYNIDNVTFTPRETLFSSSGPSTDGLSALYYNGVVTNPEIFVQTNVHSAANVKAAFRTFLQGVLTATPGIRIDVTSTTRTVEKQQELYNKWIARGKTGLPAAPPGASAHELGMAIDFTISDIATRQILARGSSSKQVWQQYRVGELAIQAGLRWGGDWAGGQYDPIHVDMTTEKAFNVSKAQFLEKYEQRANKSLQKWEFDPRTEPVAPTITAPAPPTPQAGPRINGSPTITTGTTTPPLSLNASAAQAALSTLPNIRG